MHFIGSAIVMNFRKNSQKDLATCLMFAKEIVLLSSYFGIALAHKNKSQRSIKVGKKNNKTNRIRTQINSLVDRTGVQPEVVDNLICLIRKGKLAKVITHYGEEEIDITLETDIARLTTEILLRRAS